MSETKKKTTLRSAAWFGTQDKNGFMYRSWMKNQGIPDHEFQGKPIIGICNTWSELTPCNAHFRKLAEHVGCLLACRIDHVLRECSERHFVLAGQRSERLRVQPLHLGEREVRLGRAGMGNNGLQVGGKRVPRL